MTLFFIGLFGGLIVGGSMGMLIFAMMFAAKEGDKMMMGDRQYDEQ